MVSMGCLLFISVQMFMQAVKVLPYIFCRRGFLPLQRKSSSIPTALCGVCNRVVRESACMACKRSPVRSRFTKKHCTSHEVRCFFFRGQIFGDAFVCLHVFWAFAENRDVPSDKRVCLITKETAVQQAAAQRSLLLFSAPRDGHSSLCFLYEPCSRPPTRQLPK